MTILQRRIMLSSRPLTIDVVVASGFLNIVQVGEWLDLILHQLLENPEIDVPSLRDGISDTLSTYCHVESVEIRDANA
jgi:hypothetical protein